MTEKNCEVAVVGETPSLIGESIGSVHRVLECTKPHLPWNQPQKGAICLWVVGEVTESQEMSKLHCSLCDPSPTYSTTIQQCEFPHSDEYLKLQPL